MNQEKFGNNNNNNLSGVQKEQSVNQPQDKKQDSRKEKHKVDAERQVKKIILDLKKLSEIALKYKGEYSDEDTEKIFNVLRVEVSETRKNFKLEKDNLDFSL